jgi:DMSO/TMAO reductase YedYZ heme-binding membrane subunit
VNLDRVEWAIARGAGLSAFVLLTLSVAIGMALSLRVASPRWPRVLTNELHRYVTALALWTTALHLSMLLVDPRSGMGIGDLLVPFASGYRPVAVALGILALDVLLAVWLSTLLRGRLGYRRWRRLHGLAFVAYGGALLHGVLSGTDTGRPWSTLLYVVSGLLVAVLAVLRLARARASGPGRPELAPRPGRSATLRT